MNYQKIVLLPTKSVFVTIQLLSLVSLLHLASSKIDSYNGWKNSPNVQYHIQTDEGEERYFKYQTKSGQYRKEKRLHDGTVVGTYGWVDPNGFLRLRDYIADNQGYRILKSKMIYVGDNANVGTSIPQSFQTKYSAFPGLVFGTPFENQYHRLIPPNSSPLVTQNKNLYLPPGYGHLNYQNFETATTSPAVHLSSPSQVSQTLAHSLNYPSSIPLVEVSPNSLTKSSTLLHVASTSPKVATYNDPTPKPIAIYSSSIRPAGINYVSTTSPESISSPRLVASYASTPTSVERSPTTAIAAIGYISSTQPPPPPPPVSGKFAYFPKSNNDFLTETEKNKLFYENEGKGQILYKGKTHTEENNNYHGYDEVYTVGNGFRYYLPRQYHEEQSSFDSQERTGSFGYIDPFGIRRVIYYNTSPGKGFVHRKNNRYVGFNATPYDPRPGL